MKMSEWRGWARGRKRLMLGLCFQCLDRLLLHYINGHLPGLYAHILVSNPLVSFIILDGNLKHVAHDRRK